MVINQHSPNAEEFRALFDPFEGAEVFDVPDNAISMHGLTDREVVIAFPGVESYMAVFVKEKHFVGIINNLLDRQTNKHGYPAY